MKHTDNLIQVMQSKDRKYFLGHCIRPAACQASLAIPSLKVCIFIWRCDFKALSLAAAVLLCLPRAPLGKAYQADCIWSMVDARGPL